MPITKYVLDTNCFIDAAADPEPFTAFCDAAAPGLYLSSVVSAELLTGARTEKERARILRDVVRPYARRRRVFPPSARSWEALGIVLGTLRETEGLQPSGVRRGFVFDILLAHSSRELGAVVVSRNRRDMERIASVLPFPWVLPFPEPG